MNKRLGTILQYLFFFSLGFFFVWMSVKDIDNEKWRQIRISLKHARYYLVIPVFAILILSHYTRALRWRLLMESLGYMPDKANTFFAVMIGYLANQGVPRMGEVLKCTVLSKYEKIPVDKLVGTIILERLIDAFTLLAVFGITLLIQPDLYDQIINHVFNSPEDETVKKISGLLLLLIIMGIVILLIAVWMIRKKKNFSDLGAAIKRIAARIWQGLSAIRHLKKRGQFILLTLLLWTLYLSGGLIGFQALEETQQYGIKEAFTVLSAGSIGMIVSPGGIGGYALFIEGTMILYGLKQSIAMAFGWLLWISQTVVVLLAGLLSFILLPWYNKRKQLRKTASELIRPTEIV
ncbi:MAG: lysylphosphatidylglycerol synthase transmembrane domain-containing protein [Chitinophagaceae bacterium]